MPAKKITADYGVSEQIDPSALGELVALGYSAIICNRPDSETAPDFASEAMAVAAKKLGLSFIYNPISHAGLTEENVSRQAQALSDAKGPVLAYCRSGQRSAICWALLSAAKVSADDVLAAVASAGYDLKGLRPHLEALHQG